MFVNNRTPDSTLRSWLALGVLLAIVVGWIANVALYYRLPAPLFAKGLWYAAMQTPFLPGLWIGPSVGLVLGIAVFALCARRYANHFGGSVFVKRLRGPKMVSQKLLGSQTRGGNAQLPFAGIPIPKDVENTQHFVGGSTGTGKSVCMSQYIESAVARGDRIICVDPDGASMRYFFRPGGVILNPFDKRGQGWSILNEIRTSFDCEQYAISLIPRSPSTEQETWNSMGRTIVSETLTVLLRQGAPAAEPYRLREAGRQLSDCARHHEVQDPAGGRCADGHGRWLPRSTASAQPAVYGPACPATVSATGNGIFIAKCSCLFERDRLHFQRTEVHPGIGQRRSAHRRGARRCGEEESRVDAGIRSNTQRSRRPVVPGTHRQPGRRHLPS